MVLPVQADLFQVDLFADLSAVVLDLNKLLLVFAVNGLSFYAFNAKPKGKGYVFERVPVFAVLEYLRAD